MNIKTTNDPRNPLPARVDDERATALGHVVANCATMEYYLAHGIWTLVDLYKDRPGYRYTKRRNGGALLYVFEERLLEECEKAEKTPYEPEAQRLRGVYEELKPRILEAFEERNRLVHSAWLGMPSKGSRSRDSAARLRR